jgi:uncharacterized protein YccT (UPF0319 family)
MMKTLQTILVMAALVAAGGCATAPKGVRMYPGDSQPADKVAQLAAAVDYDVKTIDGASTGRGMFSSGGAVVYELLPGPHEVVVRFYSPLEGGNSFDRPDRSDFQTLRFDAAVGRRYVLNRKTVGRDIVLSISEAGAVEAMATVVAPVKKPVAMTPPAKAPETVAAKPETPSHEKAESVEAPKITPLDNLKQWWFYASPDQRAIFRKWIDEQR